MYSITCGIVKELIPYKMVVGRHCGERRGRREMRVEGVNFHL